MKNITNPLFIATFLEGRGNFESRDKIKNQEEFMKWFNYLCNLVMSRITWETDIEELKDKSGFIEQSLLENGAVVFYRMEDLGKFACLPCTISEYNIYNEPVIVEVEEGKGRGKRKLIKGKDDFVIIWDNQYHDINMSYSDVFLCAERLTDINRTCDTRLFAHSIPFILQGGHYQTDAVKDMAEDIARHKLFMVTDSGDDINTMIHPISLVPTDFHFINNDIQLYKEKVLNEFLLMHGINYNQEEGTSQHVVRDAINSNNEAIENSLEIYLEPRETAGEKIEEIFGVKFKPKYKLGEKKKVNQMQYGEPEEVVDDEEA